MKQKKLRSYVLPTLYVIILMVVFGVVSLISSFMRETPKYLYAVDVLGEDNTTSVVDTDGGIITGIIKPFMDKNVTIDKTFYDNEASEAEQQNSLITFQNTYMKNTGVLYNCKEEFDVVTVLDGTITNIKNDEFLGQVVEIEHNANLKTIYYSIKTDLKVGHYLSQGEVIGKSSTNKISDSKYNLLIEVYYNGTLINPEEFYNMDINALY